MKLFLIKEDIIDPNGRISVDFGNGYRSYSITELREGVPIPSSVQDYSTVKVKANSKVFQNFNVISDLFSISNSDEYEIQGIRDINYTSNGTFEIRPDSGFDAITGLNITVDVPPNVDAPKDVYINANGNTEVVPNEGKDGIEKVNVHVNVPQNPLINVKDEIRQTFTGNGSQTIVPPEGFDAIGRVLVDVSVPVNPLVRVEDDKEVPAITENGPVTITPSENFDAMRSVSLDVNVPLPNIQSDKETVSITSNGEHTISPDAGFDALNGATVNVDVHPTLKNLVVPTITSPIYTRTITKDEENCEGFDSVTISVDVPTEDPLRIESSKDAGTITENGHHSIVPSDNFDVMSAVEFDVDVPDPHQVETLDLGEITTNGPITIPTPEEGVVWNNVIGTVNIDNEIHNVQPEIIKDDISITDDAQTFEFEPSEGYNALSKVTVSVPANPRKIENLDLGTITENGPISIPAHSEGFNAWGEITGTIDIDTEAHTIEGIKDVIVEEPSYEETFTPNADNGVFTGVHVKVNVPTASPEIRLSEVENDEDTPSTIPVNAYVENISVIDDIVREAHGLENATVNVQFTEEEQNITVPHTAGNNAFGNVYVNVPAVKFQTVNLGDVTDLIENNGTFTITDDPTPVEPEYLIEPIDVEEEGATTFKVTPKDGVNGISELTFKAAPKVDMTVPLNTAVFKEGEKVITLPNGLGQVKLNLFFDDNADDFDIEANINPHDFVVEINVPDTASEVDLNPTDFEVVQTQDSDEGGNSPTENP